MQWEPAAMCHQFSSPQKSSSPDGQQTACPSPSLPDTPHSMSTLPFHIPSPSSHVFCCHGSKPVGCQTQLLFFLLLCLPWEIILTPLFAPLYYLAQPETSSKVPTSLPARVPPPFPATQPPSQRA